MVLFNRKPVEYAGDNIQQVPLNALVWEIRETREVFTDYEVFLKRVGFYEQRHFTCELTGRQNLAFKAALQSEVQGSTGIDSSFPEPLKEPILRKLNLMTDGRMENLVDTAFEAFKTDYLPGEVLNYTEPDTARRTIARVREKTMLAELTFPDGHHRPAAARYTVEIQPYYSDNSDKTETITSDGSCLARDRSAFTKALLRLFLKNAFRRDNWVGAPWVVRSHYAERYGIDTTIPPHLQKGSKAHTAAQQVKHKKSIAAAAAAAATSTGKDADGESGEQAEDLLLSISKSRRPPLQRVEPALAPVYEQFLEAWAFFNVFNEILILDAFTLDDFGDALQHTGASELIDELFCAILIGLGHGTASPLEAFLETEGESEEEEAELDDADDSIVPAESNTLLEPAREALQDATGNWRDKLTKQAFHDDGFIEILVGLCMELSKEGVHQSCADIVLELSEAEGTLPDCFRSLSPTRKLGLFTTLIQLLCQTSLVRDYMEECSRNLTQVRKDRIEANRIKRSLMDEIYKLRLGMRAQYPLKKSAAGAEAAAAMLDVKLHSGAQPAQSGSAASVASEESMEEEMDDTFETASVRSDESGPRTSSRRRRARQTQGSKLKHELSFSKESDSTLSELEEDEPAQPDATHTMKSYGSRADYEADIAKIQRKVAKQDSKLATLDADFRESDMQRLKQLGQDRFHNTYWFLEAVGMPYKGMPDQSTSQAGYAAGRVFVQGPNPYALQHMADLLPSETLQARRAQELALQDAKALPNASTWACFEDPDQLEKLHRWLNPRGERETKLRSALETRFEMVSETMTCRSRYLTGDNTNGAVERRSLRHTTEEQTDLPRFAHWHNTMALQVNGRIHSAPKVQRGKATTKKRKR